MKHLPVQPSKFRLSLLLPWLLILGSGLRPCRCVRIWDEVCTQDDVVHLPFCQLDLPLDDRVEDYVNRIPTQQQIDMMSHVAAEYPPLHIPPYQWWSEGLHGAMVQCVSRADLDQRFVDVSDEQSDGQSRRTTTAPFDSQPSMNPQTLLRGYQPGLSIPSNRQYQQKQKQFRCPTSFPAPSGLGSSFNKTLWREVAAAIGREGRALLNLRPQHSTTPSQIPIGDGLTFWSPTINLQRDPRWGRNQEVPGEDPHMTGAYAVAYVNGLQSIPSSSSASQRTSPRSTPHIQIAAGCKHFVANSLENWNGITRHDFDAQVTKYDLYNYYFVPFRECVQTGNSRGVMCSYNAVNGEPSCSNNWLLKDVLRDEWNFGGYVVSDCGALVDIDNGHKAAKDAAEASAKALNATTDVNCGDGSHYPKGLHEAFQQGMVKEDQIRQSFRRMVRVQMELGLFDNDKDRTVGPSTATRIEEAEEPASDTDADWDAIDSPEHRKLAYEAALQSIILLKNDGDTLPLKRASLLETPNAAKPRVAVIGPHTHSTAALLSAYYGERCGHSDLNERDDQQTPWDTDDPETSESSPPLHGFDVDCVETPLQGLAAADPNAETIGAMGCSMIGDLPEADEAQLMKEAMELAATADTIVLALGLDRSVEREGRDRYNTTLPGLQSKLANGILDLGNPRTILVLFHGGTVSLGEELLQKAPAIVSASYGGQAASRALASVLYGDYNPTGRLAATVYPPNYVNQIPLTEMGLNVGVGRTYLYYKGPVEFPFGHGLSYSDWGVALHGGDGRLHVDVRDWSSPLSLSLTVKNLGPMPGGQSVLLFWKLIEFDLPQDKPDVEGAASVPIRLLGSASTSSASLIASEARQPQRRLCAFETAPMLKANESHMMQVDIAWKDVAVWHESLGDYGIIPGLYEVEAQVSGWWNTHVPFDNDDDDNTNNDNGIGDDSRRTGEGGHDASTSKLRVHVVAG